MNRIEIKALIQERSDWCVSIIIPTHRTSSDRRVDTEVLKQSIRHAKSILIGKRPPIDAYNLIINSIQKLELEFDPVHATEGLGLFVSSNMARTVHFPFPVKEKIIVDKSFEVRDLYYLEQFAKPYYVLQLTKDEAHLFLLEAGTMANEVTNTDFPMRNEDNYEYAKATLGTSYGYARKGFEKDKSMLNKMRQEPFYKEVSLHVMPYTNEGDLLLSGTKNILAAFDESRDKRLRIKGRIAGSFKNQKDLFDHAKTTYFLCQQNEIQLIIDRLEELAGMKRVAYGTRNVWTSATAGRGDTLLVEKDFHEEGFALPGGEQLNITITPINKQSQTNKVDHIIESIIDQGGKVIFTEENQLQSYDHIALILRY